MADIKDIKLGNTKYNIKIPSSRVKSMADYAKPSSKPSPEAIQQSDTLNAALGKLEYKADTNQTNILYVAEKTGKNLVNPELFITGGYISNSNGTVQPSETLSYMDFLEVEPNTEYYITPNQSNNWGAWYDSNKAFISGLSSYGAKTAPANAKYLRCTLYGSTYATTFMVCRKTDYDISSAYQPFSLPNSDLTGLEAEDRAALAEVVDSGAKNLCTNSSITSQIVGNFSDVSWFSEPIPAGTYVLRATVTSAQPSQMVLVNANNTALATVKPTVSSGTNVDYISEPFTLAEAAKGFKIYSNANPTTWTDIMICTKAAFGVSQKFVPFGNDPFYQVPINHNMIYRGRNLGATLTDAQHTALSGGNFTDLYLGDYWTKTVTIPAGTYTGGDSTEVTVPAQTNITLKAVIADFDTFYAGYASTYAGINTHHAAVIVTGFSNVVWNGTNSTAGGYVNSLIHKWLVGSVLPQIETWFGSAKVLSHQKLLTNAITGDAASNWAWSSQKISLLSENQMYGSKVCGGSKASNGGYEPGEAFKHLNIFNHIDANLLFGNKNIWLRDIASAGWSAYLNYVGDAYGNGASTTGVAPAALILLS